MNSLPKELQIFDRYVVERGRDDAWVVVRVSLSGLRFIVSEHETRAAARAARFEHIKAYRRVRGL